MHLRVQTMILQILAILYSTVTLPTRVRPRTVETRLMFCRRLSCTPHTPLARQGHAAHGLPPAPTKHRPTHAGSWLDRVLFELSCSCAHGVPLCSRVPPLYTTSLTCDSDPCPRDGLTRTFMHLGEMANASIMHMGEMANDDVLIQVIPSISVMWLPGAGSRSNLYAPAPIRLS